MRDGHLKHYQSLFFLLILLLSLVFIVSFNLIEIVESPVPKIVFCDVGQGDAIFFSHPNFKMLVDAGPNNGKVIDCLINHTDFASRSLDLVVLTHPDFDHLGGLADVLGLFSVTEIYMPPLARETNAFIELIEVINQQIAVNNLEVSFFPDESLILESPAMEVSFWLPYKDAFLKKNDCETEYPILKLSADNFCLTKNLSNINDGSIVTFIEIDQKNILLTGDLETHGELALYRSSLLDKVEILKVGHHGAKTSTSDLFLQYISPEKAVVSVGK